MAFSLHSRCVLVFKSIFNKKIEKVTLNLEQG